MEDKNKNLWELVGNMCLEKALTILKKENHLDVETTKVVRNLVEVAILIDSLNLQWQAQNQSGVGVSQGLASLLKATKN